MAQTETPSNSVHIEDAGPCLKKLTITIPGDRIAEQLEFSLATIVGEAEIPGFRKGRAPRQLVEKRFGGVVKSEAKNQLIASAYSEAIEEAELKVIGEPEGAEELEDLELSPGEEVTFTVEVEVAPDFELPQLEGIEVKKPVIEITDEMIDQQVDKIQQAEGTLESQEACEPGDFCIGHGVMKLKKDETAVLDLQGAVIQAPAEGADKKGAILGVMVDDFGDQMGTPKPGDTITVNAKGPAQHEDPRVRDEDLVITFEVERVERIVPASVESIVTQSGLADEEQLRESMKLRLTQRATVEQQSAMRSQIATKLLEAVDFELPAKLTSRQAERNLQRRRYEMQYRGFDDMQVEQQIAEQRDSSAEGAARELKTFFILAKAADQYEIEVTNDDISGRIAAIAAQRRMRPQDLADQLVKQNQINFIAQQVREHKVMDRLLEQAKVEEVSLEEFNQQASAEEAVDVSS